MTEPFEALRLGALTLRNRFVKAATFEGMCPGGEPSDRLRELHRRVAAGGVGMTTVAYCSVSQDGRSYDTQLWMRPRVVPAMRDLTDAVHAEGAAASLQLGHCGYFADPAVIGRRPIGPSVKWNTYRLRFARAMDDADLSRVLADHVTAATLARDAGFDAIEIHVGHGYLLSQFLSPYTNGRSDRYGGGAEARARYPAEVVGAVRDALGPGYPILVKLNLTDGFSGGLELPEAIVAARALERAGATAIVPSGGFVSKTPMYVMRGDVPVARMASAQRGVAKKLGLFVFGRALVAAYPYRPMYFLEEARRMRAAVGVPVGLLGGIRTLAEVRRALDDGFPFVVLGRALVHDPDLVRRFEEGATDASGCEPCNLCIVEMDRGGVRCVRA